MKKIQLTIVCLLIATATMFAQSAAPATKTTTTTQSGVKKEEHPNLKAAREKLLGAKKHLIEAPDDFGGHKLKAIEHIDAALKEIAEAIEWDRAHEKK